MPLFSVGCEVIASAGIHNEDELIRQASLSEMLPGYSVALNQSSFPSESETMLTPPTQESTTPQQAAGYLTLRRNKQDYRKRPTISTRYRH